MKKKSEFRKSDTRFNNTKRINQLKGRHF